MNRHVAAGWVVYVNGIEVPATDASVSCKVGDIPQARVSFPPDVTLRRVGAEDRVRVTIFYYDDENEDMRLLFEGEIVDYSYTNASQNRQLSFVAIDMIAILTQVYPFFVTTISHMVPQVGRNVASTVINPLAQTFSLFNVGLDSGEIIDRPFDFVGNILGLLRGDASNVDTRTVISTQWFNRWAERTKFANRIIPSYDHTPGESDGSAGFPILNATQSTTVLQTLGREGDEIVNSGSYYMLIKGIFQRVYYEMNPVLAPPCVAIDKESRYIQGPPESMFQGGASGGDPFDPRLTRVALGPAFGGFADILETHGATRPSQWELALVQHVTQPKNLFGIPPKCNVIWPAITKSHSYSENFATQPTRTYMGNTHMLDAVGNNGNLQLQRDHATSVGYPEQAHKALLNSRQGIGDSNKNDFLIYPEEFFRGPVYNKQDVSRWFSMINEDQNPFDSDRLQKVYAAMEHHRTRMAQRNGSVVMPFNPNPVCGHPCAVIDSVESNHHVFGYLVSINHTLGQEVMQTQISYTNGQTFEEFFEALVVQRHEFYDVALDNRTEEGFGVSTEQDPLSFVPFHPIYELRDKFQRVPPANAYYSRLLWRTEKRDVVFDWRKVVGVRSEKESKFKEPVVEKITLGLEDSNAVARENEGYFPVYDIFPEYADCMEDPQAALRFASRPVCTLEEFIDFQGEYGVREGFRAPENTREGKAGPYYVKILQLKQGPGKEMPETATGDRCGVLDVDTRRNWESRLLKFRQKVYQDDHPHKA